MNIETQEHTNVKGKKILYVKITVNKNVHYISVGEKMFNAIKEDIEYEEMTQEKEYYKETDDVQN